MSTLIEAGAEFPSVTLEEAVAGTGYLVVLERGGQGWGAYVPDLPGVVAAGATEDEVRSLIAEAIGLHLEGLREDGNPIPEPASRATWVAA